MENMALMAADKVKAVAKPETPLQDWSSRGLAQSLDIKEVVRSVVSSCLAVPIEVAEQQAFSTLHSHPLKIRNELHDWPAMQCWILEKLIQKCGESSFRMDDLHPGRMRLCQFYEYMRHNSDDSPLYIFDSQFARGKNLNRKSLVDDYSPIFSGIENDLFSIVPDSVRPPWRWFLLGGQRSGTDIHTDPLGTSAWNAVVQGRKLWVFFPPDSDPNTVSPEHRRGKRSAIEWFLDVWPSIDQQKHQTPTYTIQERGEVVFVPRGWWHVVINLTTTVAVTHNFAMLRDIEHIVPDVLANSPETFARRWILECVTQELLPSLSEIILSMAVDGDSSIQRFLQDTLKGNFKKDDVSSTDDDSGCDSDQDEMHTSEDKRRTKSATKVVFLDCDGVLANHRSASWEYEDHDNSLYYDPFRKEIPLERRCLLNLKHVLDETGAFIVLSTTWRLYPAPRKFLVSAIETIVGVSNIVIGDTPNLGMFADRGHEIDSWLQANPGVTSYVVFEDDKKHLGGMKALLDSRCIVTTIMRDDRYPMNEGITSEKAYIAIKILGPATVTPVLKKRVVCSLCNRPSTVCVCSALPKKRIHLKKCRAVVLSHPHERKKKNSSVPIISLCLDTQSMIVHHGRHLTHGSHGETVLNSMASRVLLVFPAPEAMSLDFALQQAPGLSMPLSSSPVGSYGDANDDRRINVVFIDGTWQHAKEMVARNIKAGRFPKETKIVKISMNDMRSWPPEKSGLCSYKPRRFGIRTPPSPEHFSTGETMAWVLSKIENDPSLYESLLRPLDLMVEKWDLCKKLRRETGDRSSRYDYGRECGPEEQS